MAKLDNIDTIGGSLDVDSSGATLVRMAKVSGVKGNSDERLFNAGNVQGIPILGQAHPSIPSIQVHKIRVTPDQGAENYLVAIHYKSVRLTVVCGI